MPVYTYQAKQGPTEVIEGTVTAHTRDEVVARLLRDGLVPVSIVIRAEDQPDAAPRRAGMRVRPKDVRLFTRQLTSLLRAKVELVPAVGILREQLPSRALRTLLEDLERHMRDGSSFSDAISRHPRVFSRLYHSAIRAGESAGRLDEILSRLVEFDDQQDHLESQLKGALAYPLLLLVLGAATIGFFLSFVVPRMAGLFEQLGAALPWATRTLIQLSDWLSHWWGWVAAALLAVGLILPRLRRLPVVIEATDQLLRRLPLLSDLLEARQIGRFTRTLQLLLTSGLPVFHAMEIARPMLGSRRMEARVQAAQEQVKRGGSVAESLQAARCFPPLVTHMVAVGEAGGTLVDVLDELAGYYERFLRDSLRVVTSLLEPLMVVLIGAVVGLCVLAMILPIFHMTQLVR